MGIGFEREKVREFPLSVALGVMLGEVLLPGEEDDVTELVIYMTEDLHSNLPFHEKADACGRLLYAQLHLKYEIVHNSFMEVKKQRLDERQMMAAKRKWLSEFIGSITRLRTVYVTKLSFKSSTVRKEFHHCDRSCTGGGSFDPVLALT